MKKWSSEAALPVLIVFAIIGVVLLIGLMVVAFLTLKMILVLFLGGAGLLLLIRPHYLSGLSPTMKVLVPMVFIVLAVLVYSGILEVG
jgi:hypothetical protein